MTIEEFIEARLAEDERLASAAFRHPVTYNAKTREYDRIGTDNGEWWTESRSGDVDDEKCLIVGASMTIYDEGGHTAAQAAHIARHGPARELLQVESTREILSFHGDLNIGHTKYCNFCSGELEPVAWPCKHVRLIAAIWRNHPDYQQEWAV